MGGCFIEGGFEYYRVCYCVSAVESGCRRVKEVSICYSMLQRERLKLDKRDMDKAYYIMLRATLE